jgi:hypothetical protein
VAEFGRRVVPKGTQSPDNAINNVLASVGIIQTYCGALELSGNALKKERYSAVKSRRSRAHTSIAFGPVLPYWEGRRRMRLALIDDGEHVPTNGFRTTDLMALRDRTDGARNVMDGRLGVYRPV